METVLGTSLGNTKILRNTLTQEEHDYLDKVKEILGNDWRAEAYRGWSGSENYENDLTLFYKSPISDDDKYLIARVYLDDDCEKIAVILDQFVKKYHADIEYMNKYDGYFLGLYRLFACTKDVREWLKGTKPIFDRLKTRKY